MTSAVHGTILSLAIAVSLVFPGAEGTEGPRFLEVEFSPPAQYQGEVGASGAHWFVVLFRGSDAGQMELVLPQGATQVNATFVQAKRTGLDNENVPVPLPPQTTSLPAGTRARVGPLDGAWSSLIVKARMVSLSATNAGGSLRQARVGDYLPGHFPPVSYPGDAISPGLNTPGWLDLDADGVAVNAQALQGHRPLSFTFQAAGIERLRWHNFTSSCQSDACPDAGSPWSTSADVAGTTWLQRLSYIELEAPTGTLSGHGHAAAFALGGSVIDLDLLGSLRLPGASVGGDCPAGPCDDPAGRTFSATGTFALDALAREDSGRLRSNLAGDFSAAFDETPALGFTLAAGVAASVAVVGLLWLIKALLALFARTQRPPALDHPKRRQLFALIQREPGISWRQVHRHLSWPSGNLRHHLGRLLDERLVVAHPHRNTVRYFENRGRDGTVAREVTIALRNPDAKRLHDWLLDHPGVDQTRIVQATAHWGWGRSKTRGQLTSLEEAGLLAGRPVGRRTEYTARPSIGEVPTNANLSARLVAPRLGV